MVKFYIIQIRLDNITIDKVSEKWHEKMKKELKTK